MSNNTNTHKNKKFKKQYKQMKNNTYNAVVESKTVKVGCKFIKDMVVGIGSLLGAAVSDISFAVKSFSNNKKR